MIGIYETILPLLQDSFETLATLNRCPITAALFLDIIADLFATLALSNSKPPVPRLLHADDHSRRENGVFLVASIGNGTEDYSK